MQGMRDLVRGNLARSLRTLPEEDRLAAALPVVCGPALGAHCTVERLDERRMLHLRVDTSQWLRSVVAMREVLHRDLARISGVAFEGLEFEPLHRRPVPRAGREKDATAARAKVGPPAFGELARPMRAKRRGSDE